ncbi:unnamed protein product [Cercopithifilaria johnstoni]|uniref:MAM domain-containing protein n=1 Tax=Cercopithifilaria johnstoni TaxID=2874296 RepID=A0A8J2QA60_9BILA|nr:unnamed protein product [Cercopithifilaria johnstoni]
MSYQIGRLTTLNIDAEIPQTNLSCNFDDGTLCRWRSDSDLWLIGVNIPINSYQFIPHSSNTRHLISAEVEEYDDHRAMLSFSYWKTNNISKLDVCIVQQNAFICTYTTPDTVDNELQWIRQKITLSNSLSTPFKIVFRARNIYTPSDIVAIDEIEYNSNDSPKAFISSSISRNEIWEKILPNKRAIYTSCIPIQCTFINSSTCAWTLEAPWHQLEGNIAIDSEGEGLAKSGFFSVPAEAFFEMDVWMSDNALLTVLENMGNKLMIWSRKGSSYNGNGWYRLRIPLKESEKPIQLLLKGTVPSNNFITVSNTKLVNSNGNEIRCGMNTLNSIKSHFNNIERLTAFQQLYTNEIKSTTKILKEEDSKSTRAITNNIMQTQNFYNRTSFTAPMINSNYSLSSNPKIEEIRKPLLTNDKIGKFLKNQSALPFEIIDGSTIQQQHKLHSTLSLLPFRQHDGIDHKSVTIIHSLPSPIINQYTRSNVPVKHNIMKELNALQSQIGGQPALEMQLRQLAQRFGFNQVDAGQNLELLKSVMHSKGLKPKVSDLSVDIDQEQNKKLEPIRPINNISYFIPVKIPIVQKINDIVN